MEIKKQGRIQKKHQEINWETPYYSYIAPIERCTNLRESSERRDHGLEKTKDRQRNVKPPLFKSALQYPSPYSSI